EVMARQKSADAAREEPMEVEDAPPPARREAAPSRRTEEPVEPARGGLENVFQMPRVPTGPRPVEPVRREPEPIRSSAEPVRREPEPPIAEETSPMREAMRFGSEGPRAERANVVPLMLERGEKNIDFISPRLRAKLAEAESTEEEAPRSAAMPLFAIAAALVITAVGVLLLMRFGPSAKKPAAQPAETPVTATEPVATPSAPAPPPVTTAPVRQTPAVKPPTTTAVRTTPRTTPKPIAATTAPPKSPDVTLKQTVAKVPAPTSPVSTVAAAT